MRLSDGLLYALKKVKMYMLSSKEKENALNEVRILASISDPNIVSLKEVLFYLSFISMQYFKFLFIKNIRKKKLVKNKESYL